MFCEIKHISFKKRLLKIDMIFFFKISMNSQFDVDLVLLTIIAIVYGNKL